MSWKWLSSFGRQAGQWGKQVGHFADKHPEVVAAGLDAANAVISGLANGKPRRETQQDKSEVHPQVIGTKLHELEKLNTAQARELKEHDKIIDHHESEIEEQRKLIEEHDKIVNRHVSEMEEQRKLVEEHEKIINRHTSEIEEQRKLIAGRAIWLWVLGGLNFVLVVTLIAVLLSRR